MSYERRSKFKLTTLVTRVFFISCHSQPLHLTDETFSRHLPFLGGCTAVEDLENCFFEWKTFAEQHPSDHKRSDFAGWDDEQESPSSCFSFKRLIMRNFSLRKTFFFPRFRSLWRPFFPSWLSLLKMPWGRKFEAGWATKLSRSRYLIYLVNIFPPKVLPSIRSFNYINNVSLIVDRQRQVAQARAVLGFVLWQSRINLSLHLPQLISSPSQSAQH